MSIQLPFNDNPIEHANAGWNPARLLQKTVIFGRTMVMWSGSLIVAAALIAVVRQMSDDGESQVDFDAALAQSGIPEHQLRQVGLIYHYHPSSEWVRRVPWNCEHMANDGDDGTLASGTGIGYFLHNLHSDNQSGAEPHDAALQDILTKVAHHALTELTNRETLDHLYGGWFELGYQGEEGFRKAPYAIKFWPRSKGMLGSGGPAVMGWYSGHNLVLSKMTLREQNGVVSQRMQHTAVPDFLRRDDSICQPKQTISPYFIVHVVHDTDEGIAYTHLATEPDEFDMRFEIGPSGIDVGWSDKLRERLYAMRNNTVASELKRRWDE